MSAQQEELKQFLQGALADLNKLSDHIREMQDYSEKAELILCLRELVQEQIEVPKSENSSHSAYATR